MNKLFYIELFIITTIIHHHHRWSYISVCTYILSFSIVLPPILTPTHNIFFNFTLSLNLLDNLINETSATL